MQEEKTVNAKSRDIMSDVLVRCLKKVYSTETKKEIGE